MSQGMKAQRIIKSGFLNFWRNGIVSLASLLVFTVSLFIIGSLMLGSAVFDAALTQIRDKVDITVYFKTDALESDTLRLGDAIKALPEVKEVIYKSQDQVLLEFKEQHADDSLILQSLEELGGENPLRAEINIKAHNPDDFGAISSFLANKSVTLGTGGTEIIDKVSYQSEENKDAIDRFVSFTNAAEQFGLYIAILTAFIAVLVTFNTIRLAIYTAREEISVMRLVGASDNYIRGPFVVEGVMYGVLAALFTVAILYPVTRWLSPATRNFFGSIDIFNYYISNFPKIFITLMLVGTVLGIVSSAFAIRRYLKI